MSPEQIIQTAWTTIGQRENTLWAKVRKLRFTASNFGQIVTAVRKNRYDFQKTSLVKMHYEIFKDT